MKSCLVYNANAGSADVFQHLLDECARLNACELRPAKGGGDVGLHVREAAADGVELLIVAGGDGTISTAIAALAPDFDRVTLAVLPFGTGNDFARSLGIPLDEEGIRSYIEFAAEPVLVDAVKILEHDPAWFANAANGGLGGSVAHSVDSATKDRWGPLAYWASALSTAINYEVYQTRIEIDSEVLELETAAVAITNGRYVGGGFPVAPDAFIDDGLLDVTIVPPLPLLEMAAAGISTALGNVSSSVQRHRARRIRIESRPQIPYSIDGEPVSTFEATFEVAPRVLRVIPGPVDPALNSD